jgi:hypothetical protein
VTIHGTGVFVTDAGLEVSVRPFRDTITGLTTLEPLYAGDIELLDGATGELRVHGGDPLRGTLRRSGNMFLIHSGTAPAEVWRPEREAPAPPGPVAAPPRRPRKTKARRAGTSDAEAIEAAETLARFVRGDSGVLLEAARHAHEVIARFLAKWK